MRSEVGKLMLDTVFRERANLNLAIVGSFLTFLSLYAKTKLIVLEGIKESANPWGMVCLRYEIRKLIFIFLLHFNLCLYTY